MSTFHRVAVLLGGLSPERDVSLVSGRAAWLRPHWLTGNAVLVMPMRLGCVPRRTPAV